MNIENKYLINEEIITIDDYNSIYVLVIKELVKKDGTVKENFYYEVYKTNKKGVTFIDKIKFDYYEMNTSYQVIGDYFIVYTYKAATNKKWDNVTGILECCNIKDNTKIYGNISDVLKSLGFNLNTSKLQYLQIANSKNENFKVLVTNSGKKKVSHSSSILNSDEKEKIQNLSRFGFNDYLTALKLKNFGMNYQNKEKIVNIEDYRRKK